MYRADARIAIFSAGGMLLALSLVAMGKLPSCSKIELPGSCKSGGMSDSDFYKISARANILYSYEWNKDNPNDMHVEANLAIWQREAAGNIADSEKRAKRLWFIYDRIFDCFKRVANDYGYTYDAYNNKNIEEFGVDNGSEDNIKNRTLALPPLIPSSLKAFGNPLLVQIFAALFPAVIKFLPLNPDCESDGAWENFFDSIASHKDVPLVRIPIQTLVPKKADVLPSLKSFNYAFYDPTINKPLTDIDVTPKCNALA